jgi:DNA polymerase I-like protein with 3'-5' exonuclease and polymerase domains
MVDRYENVAISGFHYFMFAFHYFMFASRKTKLPPFTLNSRIYSCILIRNDIPHRWRGRYNEDTDLSIRALKDGWCTILFSAFLAGKKQTMTMRGGNTDELYAGTEQGPTEEDGRWKMAESLRLQHPDIVAVARKWGRWQHQVDYSGFRRNRLRLRPGVTILEGVDNFGMRLVIREAPTPPTPAPAPHIEVFHTPVGAIPTIQAGMFAAPSTAWRAPEPPDLRDCRELAFDLETTGLDWRGVDRPCGVAIYPRGGVPIYLPFGHRGGDNLDERRVKDWCLTQLRGRRLWGANIKFDAHMFREWTGVDLEDLGCRLSDVQHRAALLDDHRQHFGLDVLGRDILGVGKLQGVDLSRGAAVHPSSAVGPYAERDVELTLRLADVFEPQIAAQGLGAVADLEDDIIFPVLEMERNGAPLDVEKLERWLREAEAERQATLWDVYRETGMRVDPDRPDELAALWRKLGLPEPPTTATGRPSFTGAVLKAASHPIVDKLLHAAHLADLAIKFLIPYSKRRVGDLLTFQLEQLRGEKGGTVSGRFSAHSENIQQVLSAEKQRAEYGDRYLVRELFVPRSGVLVAADARQIQLRILAHYAESPRLLAAYAADPLTDFHAEVGKMLEPFVPGFPRKRLKITNFTRIFGGGRGKIASQTGMSVEETETFLVAYDRAFPEGRAFLERASRAAKTRGYVRTFLGRRQRYPDCPKHGKGQRGPCPTCPRLHKAANDVIQGTEADVVKRKLVELHRQRHELGLTLRMVVHDEVVGDVADAEAAARVADVLDEQTTTLRVPILWSAKTGANWAVCA